MNKYLSIILCTLFLIRIDAAVLDITGWNQEQANGQNTKVKITGVATGEVPFFTGTAGQVTARKIITTDINDTTSIGRSLMTASDQAAVQAIVGVQAMPTIPGIRIPYGNGSGSLTSELALSYDAVNDRMNVGKILLGGLFKLEPSADTISLIGNSANEELLISLATSNEVSFSSGTGVNKAVFSGIDVEVPYEAYGAGWNGSNEAPTKDALYDKIQTLGSGGGSSLTEGYVGYGDSSDVLTGESVFSYNAATNVLNVPIVTSTSVTGTNLTATNLNIKDAGSDNDLTITNGVDHATDHTIILNTPDTDITIDIPAASFTIAGIELANAWGDGIKQTFNPNGTSTGLNVGSHTSNPSSLSNGDLWYNSTNNELNARINGATVALGAGGGGFAYEGTWTDSTAYSIGDVVTYATALYLCTGGHTSGILTEPNVGDNWETVWAQMVPPQQTITLIENRVAFGSPIDEFTSEAGFEYNPTTNTLDVDNLTVTTEAYDATGWNGDNTVPTKDAIRDKIESMTSGSGDVTAASNFGTDNRLIRSDGTTKGVQASGITIDDSNNITGVGGLTVTTLNTTTINAGAFEFEGATPDAFETTITVVDPTNDNTWTLPDTTDTVVGLAAPQTLTNKNLTTPTITGAITFPDNVEQVFNPGAANAGLNVGSIAGDPSAPNNGALWYDSTANELTARINGSNVALGAGGGGSSLTATYVGYGNGSNALTGEAAFTYDAGTDTLTVGNLDVSTLNTTTLTADNFEFEGTTADGFETTMVAADPTADNTVTIPNAEGYFMLSDGGPIANTRIPFGLTGDKFTSDSVFNYNSGTDTLAVPNLTLSTGGALGASTATTPSANDSDTSVATTAYVQGEIAEAIKGSFGITVDGGGSVVTTGSKGFVIVPFACTITGWSIVADASGSVTFDVEKAADGVIPSSSIVASAPPLLSSDQIERSTTLTGWTTAVTANDVIEFEVTGSPATITRATLQIHYTR